MFLHFFIGDIQSFRQKLPGQIFLTYGLDDLNKRGENLVELIDQTDMLQLYMYLCFNLPLLLMIIIIHYIYIVLYTYVSKRFYENT